jgi:hypothetical protein
MIRRTFAVAAVAALMAGSAHAAKAPEATVPVPEKPAQERVALRAIFAAANGAVLTDDANGVTIGPMAVDVIVARVGADGKLVKACVNNEGAARRFLEAPVAKIIANQAKEQ